MKIIKEVEDEVAAEMKRDDTFARMGFGKNYFYRKKKKLQAKGIEWRSPSELNPNVRYH